MQSGTFISLLSLAASSNADCLFPVRLLARSSRFERDWWSFALILFAVRPAVPFEIPQMSATWRTECFLRSISAAFFLSLLHHGHVPLYGLPEAFEVASKEASQDNAAIDGSQSFDFYRFLFIRRFLSRMDPPFLKSVEFKVFLELV